MWRFIILFSLLLRGLGFSRTNRNVDTPVHFSWRRCPSGIGSRSPLVVAGKTAAESCKPGSESWEEGRQVPRRGRGLGQGAEEGSKPENFTYQLLHSASKLSAYMGMFS